MAAGPSNARYACGLARACGGAIIFAFPLLMTMEMWWLGFYMDRLRLFLFLAITLPLLVGLSYHAGFQETFRWRDDLMDALAAFGIGIVASALLLGAFGLLTPDMAWGEIMGKIALQAIPASIGAMVARKQMGQEKERDREQEQRRAASYPSQLFLMAVGALFVAFNVAPTEEMVLISYMMTPWHQLGLVLLSLVVLHAFVYTVGFAGQESPPGDGGFWRTFMHYTIAGYGLALLVSIYVLWTFGRTDGIGLAAVVSMTVVLGFPAALGAATARLVV